VGYRQKILDEIASLRVFDASGSAAYGGPLESGSCLDSNGNLSYPQDPTQEAGVPCRNYPPNDSPYCFNTALNTIPPTPAGLPDETVFTDDHCFQETPPGFIHQGPFVRPSDGMHFERAFLGFTCPPATDNARCPGTTNTGGAFFASGNEFTRVPGFRQESLWIVIMLTDGKADHSNGNLYCPNGVGTGCQDASVKTFASGTRHCLPSGNALYNGLTFLYNACKAVPVGGTGGTDDITGVNFDADDYARTQADFVALGQQALIYTIGFGNFLDHGNPTSAGEQLLNYAADIGDDGKIDTGTGLLNSDYFYAHDATALSQIFKTISDRISTRLTH
jgi:hypothetical protein